MLVALLTLTTASHVVTGTIMWVFKGRLEFTLWLVNVDLSLSLLLTFFNSSSLRFNTLTSHATCSVAWGIITALILFVVALPKSFHEFSFLAFIDFASIVGAVLITIIATGVSRESNVEWHAFLPEGQRPDLQGAFLAVTVSRCHLLSRFQDFTDLSPYLSKFVEYCVGISLVSNFVFMPSHWPFTSLPPNQPVSPSPTFRSFRLSSRNSRIRTSTWKRSPWPFLWRLLCMRWLEVLSMWVSDSPCTVYSIEVDWLPISDIFSTGLCRIWRTVASSTQRFSNDFQDRFWSCTSCHHDLRFHQYYHCC